MVGRPGPGVVSFGSKRSKGRRLSTGEVLAKKVRF
jgi:hypothetical protein